MLALLADENFNGDIIRGLLLRKPEMDIVRAQDVGLGEAEDARILEWAVTAGFKMPGVFVLHNRFPIGQAVEELLLVIECSSGADWNNRIIYLPL